MLFLHPPPSPPSPNPARGTIIANPTPRGGPLGRPAAMNKP